MIPPGYKIGETLMLATDVDKLKRIVTGFTVRATGVLYLLSCGTGPETAHYDFEIITEKEAPRAGFKQ